MKEKIIGIGVCMLMIVTAIVPVAGTIQEPRNTTISQFDGPTMEWSFITGGPYQDMFTTIYETEDKGFVAAGVTENPTNVYSAWVIKLDKNGNEVWRTIETEVQGTDYLKFGIADICQTQDGGYIVAGACERLADLQDAFLWKLNADGETQWFNSAYTGSNAFGTYIVVPWDIIPVVNGYLMTGGAWYMGELYFLDVDAVMIKTDLNGNMVWKQTYRYGEDHDEIHGTYATLDGGYINVGTVNNFIFGVPSQNDSDIWVIKTDAEGKKQWEKTFGGSENEWVLTKNMYQTNDGGFILNAMTSSYNVETTSDWCVMLLKLDGNGNELWNKTYGLPTQGTSSWGMALSSDGGFVLSATKNHNGFSKPKDDMLLVKTDSNGNVEWDQIYGGDNTDRCYAARQGSDGGYIISGATVSFTVAGDWDGCIVKYSSFDNNRPAKPTTPSGSSRGKVAEEYTFSTSTSDSDGDDVYYKWDWGDGNFSDWLSTPQATYSWSYEARFEVRVMAQDEHGGQSDWSDPLPFSTPYSYDKPIPQFVDLLFQRFPNAFLLLRHLGGCQ